MSRRTPPAPIAASCWSSPISRTLPPRLEDEVDDGVQGEGVGHAGLVDDHQRAWGRSAAAQSGRSPVRQGPGELGEGVGAGADLLAQDRRPRPRTGRGRCTVPPSSVQARARARMAVVLPAPAGAIASCSRAPEVAISRDQRGLSGVEGDPVGGLLQQRQVDGVAGWRRARRGGRRRRPGAVRRPGSRRRCTGRSRPPCRRWHPSARRSAAGFGDAVLGAGEPHRAGGQDLVDEQVHDRARRGRRARRRRGPGAAPRRARARSARSTGAASHRGHGSAVRWLAPTPRPPLDAWLVGRGDRAAVDHRRGRRRGRRAPARPRARQLVRCSARVRGSCLASRVSRVACWARWIASTGVGGRPWSAWNAAASSPRRASMVARRVDQRCVQAGVDTDDLAHRPLAALGVRALGERDARAARAGASRGRCCRSPRRRRWP